MGLVTRKTRIQISDLSLTIHVILGRLLNPFWPQFLYLLSSKNRLAIYPVGVFRRLGLITIKQINGWQIDGQ